MRWVSLIVLVGGLCGSAAAQASRPATQPPDPARRAASHGAVFTARGGADKIVYVLDASGSMMNVFDSVRMMVENSIDSLEEGQSFNIVVFRDLEVQTYSNDGLVTATAQNKEGARKWLDEKVVPAGQATAEAALTKAFSMGPQIVHFFSDGFVTPKEAKSVADTVQTLNKARTAKINCVFFDGRDRPEDGIEMEQLAKNHGGDFVTISAKTGKPKQGTGR